MNSLMVKVDDKDVAGIFFRGGEVKKKVSNIQHSYHNISKNQIYNDVFRICCNNQ
jgi:hypothetical protein